MYLIAQIKAAKPSKYSEFSNFSVTLVCRRLLQAVESHTKTNRGTESASPAPTAILH